MNYFKSLLRGNESNNEDALVEEWEPSDCKT